MVEENVIPARWVMAKRALAGKVVGGRGGQMAGRTEVGRAFVLPGGVAIIAKGFGVFTDQRPFGMIGAQCTAEEWHFVWRNRGNRALGGPTTETASDQRLGRLGVGNRQQGVLLPTYQPGKQFVDLYPDGIHLAGLFHRRNDENCEGIGDGLRDGGKTLTEQVSIRGWGEGHRRRSVIQAGVENIQGDQLVFSSGEAFQIFGVLFHQIEKVERFLGRVADQADAGILGIFLDRKEEFPGAEGLENRQCKSACG